MIKYINYQEYKIIILFITYVNQILLSFQIPLLFHI